jgi:hypothetical protein
LPWGEEFIASLEAQERYEAALPADELGIIDAVVYRTGTLHDTGKRAASRIFNSIST